MIIVSLSLLFSIKLFIYLSFLFSSSTLIIISFGERGESRGGVGRAMGLGQEGGRGGGGRMLQPELRVNTVLMVLHLCIIYSCGNVPPYSLPTLNAVSFAWSM